MDIEYDFSDLPTLDDVKMEVEKEMNSVGEDSVQYAIENGSYKNRTGNLRKSNSFSTSEQGLEIKNDADYASFVESKGFDVISGASLNAEKILKEDYE